MKYKSKSIKTVLGENKDELFALMASKSQFGQLKEKVNEILSSEDLRGNESVDQAREIFRKAGGSYNYFISCLAAYLTGISASK